MFSYNDMAARSRLSEYTPEPDIFHDVFGHVPMHAHPIFRNFLQHYGQICAGLITRPDRSGANGACLLVHRRV